MTDSPDQSSEFGCRSGTVERYRLLALLLVLAGVVLLELTLGRAWTADQRADLLEQAAGGDWGMAVFADPDGEVTVPPKPDGLERIAYLSNSHAVTGGRVPHHMQQLLDEVAPGRFDIVDMASAGIFAPDFLLRMARATNFDLDAVVISSAYISFSDRMGLGRQSPSARSFFNDGVAGRLDAGFWWRNFDIGLYLDMLASRWLPLLRYRAQMYALWSEPLSRWFADVTGDPETLFLTIDVQQRWRFPEGYDRNLFQWRLYSAGRDGHVGDMGELVNLAAGQDIPLLALNLPVHWDKGRYPHKPDDVALFLREMSTVYEGATRYVDYQGQFPVEFTSYDALHPTWIGARLHAIDALFQLQTMGLLPGVEPDALVDAFVRTGQAQSETYLSTITEAIEPLPAEQLRGFVRYDLMDADNARLLLRRSLVFPLAGPQQQDLLRNLALRLRYWSERQFPLPESWRGSPLERVYAQALENAGKRLGWFSERLTSLQTARMQMFALPKLTADTLRASKQVQVQALAPGPDGSTLRERAIVTVETHEIGGGTRVKRMVAGDGRPFTVLVFNPQAGIGYRRVDVLGDGSFLGVVSPNNGDFVPAWVVFREPIVGFGI